MAWYDGILDTIGTIGERTGNLLDEYLNAEADRVSEEIRNPSAPDDTAAAQLQAGARGAATAGGINWTKWGVIVGAASVLLGGYALLKRKG